VHYIYNWYGKTPGSGLAAQSRELSGYNPYGFTGRNSGKAAELGQFQLSKMEKTAVTVGALAAVGWFLFLRKKK